MQALESRVQVAHAQVTEGFAQHIHEMARLKVLAANPQLLGRIRTFKVPVKAPRSVRKCPKF